MSATAAIIGLSIVLAIELIVATTIPTIVNIHGSYDDMRERSINRFQTDINITSVTTSDNGSNYDLNATVKNIGSITLKTIDFNILINGSIQNFKCTNSFLYPDKKASFNVYNIPGSGVSRLKIITNNGIFDYYTYTVV